MKPTTLFTWTLAGLLAGALASCTHAPSPGKPVLAAPALPPRFDAARDGPMLAARKSVELKTNAGTIILELDPALAPITCTQLYKLFNGGVFDGTPICRYEANFVMQVALAETKAPGQPALSATARSMLRRLPLEVERQQDGTVKHAKYILSMARDDQPTDSAVSSFSILLGPAPHLDKKYTIFGKVADDSSSKQTIDNICNHWSAQKFWIVSARGR